MRQFSFYVDRGGTFTDVVLKNAATSADGSFVVSKLLSVDPSNYSDAPTEGIRRLLEQETGLPHPRGLPLDTSRIAEIRMGTTVATNALLERKGERMAFVVTSGFRDLLYIGNQARPRIFDLEVRMDEVLYEAVVEVDELVSLPLGADASPRNGVAGGPRAHLAGRAVSSVTGEALVVRRPLRPDAVRAQLAPLLARGIRSLAVCLKHAALWHEHELQVGALAKEMGFEHVSLSHALLPAVKMVPRGFTAAADAYLTPAIQRYLSTFVRGFDGGLLAGGGVRLSFMQSDGGLADAAAFCGHKAILSGPAGGVVGYASTTRWAGAPPPPEVIGFDMGGTSTDVSRCAGGACEHVFETSVAGVTLAAPQLDVSTVAAGGGSVLSYSAGLFRVGPESVGAHPGPACYRKGGDKAAVTDANLFLGRIVPSFFPSIFGPGEDQPLDEAAPAALFAALAARVNSERAAGAAALSPEEVACGFLEVANEAMCRPIRALTNMKGYEASSHVLACFGGAGGQHACAIARALGIRTVFVHRLSSVLSALGIGLADCVAEAREPAAVTLVGADGGAALEGRFALLEARAAAELGRQGFAASGLRMQRFLNVRFEGTDTALMVEKPGDGDYGAAFLLRYKREFGFVLDRPLLVDDLRVRASAAGATLLRASDSAAASAPPSLPPPPPLVHSSTFFAGLGRVRTPVFPLSQLPPGTTVSGPALLVDAITTLLVEPGCVAQVTADGDVRVEVPPPAAAGEGEGAAEVVDPVRLSIFGHRFMGIAEQMGRTLQRTSVSVNIKERLDFSCALFGADGGLVANAPHLPVHLGAMQEAVRFQLAHASRPGGEPLRRGDVFLSNHPQLAGGSHLPDMTVITPAWAEGIDTPVFFVASRGHHADIGGVAPGSMPPNSTLLAQEGAAIVSFRLVRGGEFDEAGVSALLLAPAALPGCSGARCLSDNLSDLRAQVAANTRGIALLGELVAEQGLSTVQSYMAHIRVAAERAVRGMLAAFSLAQGLPARGGSVQAEDFLDDGTPIRLRVSIDREAGDASASAVFDFTGTGPQVVGNLNAPPAVTFSAVIYALRCMLRDDIPLNQGCLAPITITIPPRCVLSPGPEAAVVGGNVLTSQRVTDVVLRAFRACADSQGCMNNLTFGDSQFGYYETVCGGAGAGPGWHGRAGVQCQMTNTRITDPELLERRYPVVLRAFRLRSGSGGAGQWRGGDGALRELEVLRPLSVGILSERRARPPGGLDGGGPASMGLNLWLQSSCDGLTLESGEEAGEAAEVPTGFAGRVVSLGGKATVEMRTGDRMRLLTPGGGGYGPAPSASSS